MRSASIDWAKLRETAVDVDSSPAQPRRSEPLTLAQEWTAWREAHPEEYRRLPLTKRVILALADLLDPVQPTQAH